jgi:diguanylate cyclase (GGDEF)-like protein/PAS domain S-box-containing protein
VVADQPLMYTCLPLQGKWRMEHPEIEQQNTSDDAALSANGSSQESEERFRALTQNSSDVITLLGVRGTIRYQSPSAERILGYRPEEMIGENVFDYVHPEDLGLVEMTFVEGLRDPGRRPSVQYRLRHKDGSWRWLESVVANLLGHRDVGGVVFNSRDVTERRRTEERLSETEEKYRTLVERIPAIIYVQEPNDPNRTTYVSPQYEATLGYPLEEDLGDPDHWVRIMHHEDRERVLAEDRRTNETGEPFKVEYRLFAKDGRVVWIRDEATLVRDEEGRPLYWLGIQLDVTDQKRAKDALRESEERFKSSFRDAAIGMALVATDGRWLQVNRALCRIVGYSEEELLEKSFQDITHPDDLEADLNQIHRMLVGEIETYQMEKRYLHKGGSVVWGLLSVSLVHDEGGEPLYFVAQIQDITERKVLEEQLEHRAFHDHLTDLPNRYLFVDRLGQALKRTKRRKGRRVAVLFVDLDRFKVINDSLGHEAGDLLLVLVSERLRRCLRPEDTLARFGGDEFVALLQDVEDPGEAIKVAGRITDELKKPFVLEGRELFVRASLGVAIGDADTPSPEGLLRDADTAMYRAKHEGSDCRMFDPAMYELALKRLELEHDLRHAVESEQLVVHYQPIVDLQSGEAWGVEALVRWEHPERGLLSPTEFVPVAEESGLVIPIGERMLEEACRWATGWQEEHPRTRPLVVSVNLSARQLRRPDLARTVEKVLRETGLDAHCLSLDITETVYVETLEENTAALDELKRMGVRISIDDFGMGYSSLSYLKRLPADALKIDKSFVAGLGEDIEDTAIVGMVIDLAHTFGMEVVAEGVESWAQAELLRDMGCDMAQGFCFSEPVPTEKIPALLWSDPHA